MASSVQICCVSMIAQQLILTLADGVDQKCVTNTDSVSKGCIGHSLLQKSHHQSLVSYSVPDLQIYTNASDEAPATFHESSNVLLETDALTSAQKAAIVSKHNVLRAAVHVPCTAADMETLQWDDGLAAASQAYAERCIWQHDPTNHQNHWGENLAMSWSSAGNSYDSSSLELMVQHWYDEIVDVEWVAGDSNIRPKMYADPQSQCKSSTGSGCMIGHYTQVVWASSNKVGCGVAKCTSGLMGKGGTYLVCKYNPPGNMRAGPERTVPPFIVGKPCASCSACSTAAGVAGKLCAIGDVPTRCEDSITTMNFNGVPYKDCASLTTAVAPFCLLYNQKFHICDLTCKACEIPKNVGPKFCSA